MTARIDAFPEWKEVEGGFVCADDEQMQFAFACELMCGFDLPRFDIWAKTLPDREHKQVLEDRYLAWKALIANNLDAAFRHLQTMYGAMLYDKREQFLLPQAQKADRENRARIEQMGKARRHRQQKHDWDAVMRLEAELLAAGKSERDLAGIIETRLGVPKTTYREWRRSRKTTV